MAELREMRFGILIGILCILLTYLVVLWWRRPHNSAEGFMTGDVAGKYYVAIYDSAFATAGAGTYYDDSPNEVFFVKTASAATAASGAFGMPVATLTQIRREIGYGLNTLLAGAIINDEAGTASSPIYVYANSSNRGTVLRGGGPGYASLDNSACVHGCAIVNTTGNGVFLYGKKPASGDAKKIAGYEVAPFNDVTGQWSRYTPLAKQPEAYLVYSLSGDTISSIDDKKRNDICNLYGGVVAGIQQITEAQAGAGAGGAAGAATTANWKTAGWLTYDNPLKAVYPISSDADKSTCKLGSGATETCKNTIYTVKSLTSAPGPSGTLTFPETSLSGVICYGPKPAFSERDKEIDKSTYRAEYFNTFTRTWSAYQAAEYKCADTTYTRDTAGEKNALRRALKYVQAMQSVGAKITLGDISGAYPGCGAGADSDDGANCWACVPLVGATPTTPAPIKSVSGQWKSIGESINPAADLTERSLDVSTTDGKERLKTAIRNVLACQAAGGVPTLGANANYKGCGDGWCCAPDAKLTLDLSTFAGPEQAGECSPAEPPCISSELLPTRPGGGTVKKQCRPKLAPEIRDTKVNRAKREAEHTLMDYYNKIKPALMRDVAQQMKADKIYALKAGSAALV